MMSMDPFYIHMALQPVSGIIGANAAWGPLYALWLKPFVVILGDPLEVYTANVYALSIGASALVYLYLLVLTRQAAIAVGAALFFLISDCNVPLASKVSEFALLIILAGLVASELAGAGARRMGVATLGVLLAAYARPELYPAAVCLWLATVWLAYCEGRRFGWRILVWPSAVAACMVIAASSAGVPVLGSTDGNDRLLMAFREHFAWNWGRWHNEWKYFLSIWQLEFGAAETIGQAFLNNPGAVTRHLADNLLGTVVFLAGSAFAHYPIVVPATNSVLVRAETVLISLMLFGSMAWVAVRPELRRGMIERYGHALMTYAVIATVSLVSATLIFPVPHYLVIPGVLLLMLAALAISVIEPPRPVYSWRARVAAALICLAVTPKPFVLPSTYAVPDSPFKGRIAVARTVTDTIELVRSLHLASPVRVLTITDGMGTMLGPGFEEIRMWQKGPQPLDAYIRDNDVGVIVNLEGGHDSFTVDDPYWKVIHNTPANAGFSRVHVPNHDGVRVYVRTDLLQRPVDSTHLDEKDGRRGETDG